MRIIYSDGEKCFVQSIKTYPPLEKREEKGFADKTFPTLWRQSIAHMGNIYQRFIAQKSCYVNKYDKSDGTMFNALRMGIISFFNRILWVTFRPHEWTNQLFPPQSDHQRNSMGKLLSSLHEDGDYQKSPLAAWNEHHKDRCVIKSFLTNTFVIILWAENLNIFFLTIDNKENYCRGKSLIVVWGELVTESRAALKKSTVIRNYEGWNDINCVLWEFMQMKLQFELKLINRKIIIATWCGKSNWSCEGDEIVIT